MKKDIYKKFQFHCPYCETENNRILYEKLSERKELIKCFNCDKDFVLRVELVPRINTLKIEGEGQ